MANEIAIKITNIEQIKSAFHKAPSLMIKELDLAIRKVTLNVQRQSMINTPVATGRLRASSYSRFSQLQGVTGTNTNYDVFVHDGTRYMKARPYLRDAVEETSQESDKFFTQAVDNVLSAIGKEV